jgi:RNA polymerase sigma factor (sigma-70 family)
VDDLTDRQVWELVVSGDAEAFGLLFVRHAGAIYNHCFRATADWALAEDLTSLVFLEVWRTRAHVRFGRDGSLLPWLYGISTNLVRNHRRTAWRHRAALRRLSDIERTKPREQLPDNEGEAQGREILATLARLPRRERDVVALCIWAGLSYEEAALALDVPVGTVRSRLARARRKLQRHLETDGRGRTLLTPRLQRSDD